MKKIVIVAGETSGDLLGAALVEALNGTGINIQWTGIAGPKMQTLGVKSLFPMEALSVRGYVEALSALPRILKIRRQLIRQCLTERPDMYIGIDAPDFNLGVERRLKKAGIPTVHFVSPSVWAWRRKRLNSMRQSVDHTLLIFPIEESLYREAGCPATYVGHPLAQILPPRHEKQARERLGLEAGRQYCVLMPGSRQGELAQHADLFIATAALLSHRRPDIGFLAPFATRETRLAFEAAMNRAQAWDLPIRLLFGHSQDALEAADCALIASGTATLEAALKACPHIITYRVPRFTAWIMRRKAYLSWVGLPNILAGRELVPEILQEKATPENLANALETLLTDPDEANAQREGLNALRADLSRDTRHLMAEALKPFLS